MAARALKVSDPVSPFRNFGIYVPTPERVFGEVDDVFWSGGLWTGGATVTVTRNNAVSWTASIELPQLWVYPPNPTPIPDRGDEYLEFFAAWKHHPTRDCMFKVSWDGSPAIRASGIEKAGNWIYWTRAYTNSPQYILLDQSSTLSQAWSGSPYSESVLARYRIHSRITGVYGPPHPSVWFYSLARNGKYDVNFTFTLEHIRGRWIGAESADIVQL